MEITPVFEKVQTSIIKELEAEYGIKFPQDYFEFLEVHNGGFAEPSTFEINPSQGKTSIDILYGINNVESKYEHLDLGKNFKTLKRRMPTEIFPIGNDPGGNFICICLNGANYGKIYFYDHEIDNRDDKGNLTWANLYLVSNSFSDFLKKLI